MTKQSNKKPGAAVVKYATTVARNALGDGMPNVELKEHDEATVAYYDGVPFCAYWFEDTEIVYRFRRPSDDSVRSEQAKYYRELSSPERWLEYRRPLSRDPKPDLASKKGQVMGKAFFEISQGTLSLEPVTIEEIRAPASGSVSPDASGQDSSSPMSITSGGGPYIALPESKLSSYPGFSDEALNESIFRAAKDEGSVAELPVGQALLLGTPDPLYWFPNEAGGYLVRVGSFDADDDELLARKVAQLDDDDWSDIEGTLQVKEPWQVFDSALDGSSAATEGLTLALTPGSYVLSSREVTEDDCGFLIVRLRRK